MKIYCILFDTFPRHPQMENLFKSKNLHYSDYLTNSCTGLTLTSMFSGVTPSEMRTSGIGHSHTYARLSNEDKEIWDKKIVFKDLPDDWKIHIHSMPNTRGDDNSIPNSWPMYTDSNTVPGLNDCKLLPDDICGRFREFKFYNYNEGADEEGFISKMQSLPNDENHFICLKYNHYHDTERGKHNDIFSLFKDIIKKIDFEEENSLFWLFADHGEPEGIDILQSPPDSWLAWVSITDNITNKKVEKDLISCLDFKNTVLNRIYNRELPNDVLSKLDKNRIYVAEDGRGLVDEDNCTTVSAIKYLDENRYTQYTIHNPRAVSKMYDNTTERTLIYDKSKKGTDGNLGITNRSFELSEINDELKNYLKNNIWKWYFTNE
tara:strand:+ start:5894 stop:7021 length:1128 start_codon:yes stop_codon:yes gene_type:complete